MRISELQELLEKAKEEYGDVDVKLYSYEDLEEYSITAVEILEKDYTYVEIY